MIIPDERKQRPRDVKINNEETCVAFERASVCDLGWKNTWFPRVDKEIFLTV